MMNHKVLSLLFKEYFAFRSFVEARLDIDEETSTIVSSV